MRYIYSLALTLILPSSIYAQTIPNDLVDWWRSNAPYCTDSSKVKFPGKLRGGECDDGDVNLFAGLLCASGERIGCDTVRNAQDESGKWFRSPRRMQQNNLGRKDSFSPDMALGTQLYVSQITNKKAFGSWLRWLDDVRPCWIGDGPQCFRSPLLRYCTDDTENGCTLRPGDLAILNSTSEYLQTYPPTGDTRNLLQQAGGALTNILLADANFNKPGYSQHLTAVEIFLLRLQGHNDDYLSAAALTLAQKQPNNPFFQYLHEGATKRVSDLTLSLCPTPKTGVPKDPSEWSWEREDSDQAWKNSMVWDCIFMANLLKAKP
ncbi:hypothetical protein [Ralstonia pseudosolanacearum]|uniref:hypothetical protein n=1 Tax=Ralstonia pseudosolanacearum TaxID=1310165 RepID=UPI003D07B73C